MNKSCPPVIKPWQDQFEKMIAGSQQIHTFHRLRTLPVGTVEGTIAIPGNSNRLMLALLGSGIKDLIMPRCMPVGRVQETPMDTGQFIYYYNYHFGLCTDDWIIHPTIGGSYTISYIETILGT